MSTRGNGRPLDFGAGKAAVAIGIGCKRGCSADVIVALVARATAAASCVDTSACLFTHEAKKNEPGLGDAAKMLGLPLVFLDEESMRQASLRAATSSPRVMALFGLPSIAETAALAGAGPSSVLLVARMSDGGASCAIASKKA
ncbi:MAG TPA: cobalamin biosynthesis protein [Methylocella sp.]|nr:cobalamin biosynthesis protein [Methylocella sp.]